MKIELKNIKYSASLSEETNAFTADLHINGKKVGYVKNDGGGGCTFYSHYDKNGREAITEAEAYYQKQPKIYDKEFNFHYQQTLENTIDDIFEAWLKVRADKKWEKKVEADMKKGILVGNKSSYRILTFKGITLEQILKANHPNHIKVLKKVVAEQVAKGETILNTNLPQSVLIT